MARPIEELPNLGPISAAELSQIGVNQVEDLQRLGWEEVWAKLVEAYPLRLNINMGYALAGALEGCDWRDLPLITRDQVKALAKELRKKRNKNRKLWL